MPDFPQFMKNPANRIASEADGTEGYAYDGADGSQVVFWSCTETAITRQHAHEHDEYLLVVEGCFTLLIQGRSIELKAGQEYSIPKGVPHAGKVLEGTRTIHVFGGRHTVRTTGG